MVKYRFEREAAEKSCWQIQQETLLQDLLFDMKFNFASDLCV